MEDPSPDREAVSDIELLRQAVRDAEQRAGEVEGELVELQGQLMAAEEVQQRWSSLLAEIEHERAEARRAIANHEAILNSTTWRLSWMVLAPYRRVGAAYRSRRDRSV